MQGGGGAGSGLFRGLDALTGIDGRPLALAFAICGGAVLYFSLSFEPDFRVIAATSAALLVMWIVARKWWTSDIAIALVMVAFGVSLGCAAAGLRARLVSAPVIASETGPVMLEGWVQEIEPGNRGVRLLLRVHSIAGLATESWPKFVRVTHTSRLEVAPGRFVRCWSVLRPPPSPLNAGRI